MGFLVQVDHLIKMAVTHHYYVQALRMSRYGIAAYCPNGFDAGENRVVPAVDFAQDAQATALHGMIESVGFVSTVAVAAGEFLNAEESPFTRILTP